MGHCLQEEAVHGHEEAALHDEAAALHDEEALHGEAALHGEGVRHILQLHQVAGRCCQAVADSFHIQLEVRQSGNTGLHLVHSRPGDPCRKLAVADRAGLSPQVESDSNHLGFLGLGFLGYPGSNHGERLLRALRDWLPAQLRCLFAEHERKDQCFASKYTGWTQEGRCSHRCAASGNTPELVQARYAELAEARYASGWRAPAEARYMVLAAHQVAARRAAARQAAARRAARRAEGCRHSSHCLVEGSQLQAEGSLAQEDNLLAVDNCELHAAAVAHLEGLDSGNDHNQRAVAGSLPDMASEGACWVVQASVPRRSDETSCGSAAR